MDQVQELIQFIRTTFQKPEAFIPLHEPTFNGKEKEYLNECIDSTFVSSVGKFVDLFEEKINLLSEFLKSILAILVPYICLLYSKINLLALSK